MTVGRTKVVSVHRLRAAARRRERKLQRALNAGEKSKRVPEWARGVRVEDAGPLQYAVVATEGKGH